MDGCRRPAVTTIARTLDPATASLGPLGSLLAQVLALLAGAVAVAVLVRRPGGAFRPWEATGLAVAALLVVFFVANVWESSQALDRLRKAHTELTARNAREQCAFNTAIDPNFLGWLVARIPAHERYHLAMDPVLRRMSGDTCAAMILLPRRRVAAPERARYIILWGVEPVGLRDELTRPGNVVRRFTPRHRLIRRP